MARMIMTVGLPASGKTTYARKLISEHPEIVNVNRDDLREMLFGGWTGEAEHEQAVTKVAHTIINGVFKKNGTVIVSDTNLNRKNVVSLVKIADKWGAEVEFVYFDTSLEECIARDKDRIIAGQRGTGEEVIRRFHQRYVKKGKVPRFDDIDISVHQAEPYVPIKGSHKAIIVDLDGTVALHKRSPYDYDQLHTDQPNWPVIKCVIDEYDAGTHILFTSGRPDSHYDMTIEWLSYYMDLIPNEDHGVKLFMRDAADKRMDAIVKQEIFDEKIRPFYDVKYCFDDRNQVVDAWRRIGLTVFQVAEGDF